MPNWCWIVLSRYMMVYFWLNLIFNILVFIFYYPPIQNHKVHIINSKHLISVWVYISSRKIFRNYFSFTAINSYFTPYSRISIGDLNIICTQSEWSLNLLLSKLFVAIFNTFTSSPLLFPNNLRLPHLVTQIYVI